MKKPKILKVKVLFHGSPEQKAALDEMAFHKRYARVALLQSQRRYCFLCGAESDVPMKHYWCGLGKSDGEMERHPCCDSCFEKLKSGGTWTGLGCGGSYYD